MSGCSSLVEFSLKSCSSKFLHISGRFLTCLPLAIVSRNWDCKPLGWHKCCGLCWWMCPVVVAASQPALLAISTTAGGCNEQEREIKGQKMRQKHKNKTIHLNVQETFTFLLRNVRSSLFNVSACMYCWRKSCLTNGIAKLFMIEVN